MARRRLQLVPVQHLLLLLLLLLGFAAAANAAAGDEFPGEDDILGKENERGIGGGGDEGEDDDASSPMPRRSGGGDSGFGGQPGGASAELAGGAALGGLRRRLELDGALDEALRAGSAAAEQLRRQAVEIAELRAENAELRAAVSTAASAVSAAAAAADTAAAAEAAASSPEKRAASPAMVSPPAGVDAERDRDLVHLALLLAHPGRKRPEEDEGAGGAGCFPARTPLANCAQVRKRFGLALDAEAAALCDSHRLCAACSASYGIPAAACDRAYVAVAAGLCLKEADPVGCGRQADILLADMRAVHAPADAVAAGIIGCQRPCAARLLSTVRGN